jgi:PBP1b-binding outer membrane lipoprotein LpoB
VRVKIKLLGSISFIALIFTSCGTVEKEEVLDMEQVQTEIQALEDAFATGEKQRMLSRLLPITAKTP